MVPATALAVVVGARRQRLPVRRRAVRDQAVLARERRDHLGRQSLEHGRRDPVRCARSVRPFVRSNAGNISRTFSKVAASRPALGLSSGWARPCAIAAPVEVLAQPVDVVAARLDLVVLVAGDVPGEDVHDAAVLGEDGWSPLPTGRSPADRSASDRRRSCRGPSASPATCRAPCRDRTGAPARHSSPASRIAACTTRRSRGTPPSEGAGRSALCASCPGAGR